MVSARIGAASRLRQARRLNARRGDCYLGGMKAHPPPEVIRVSTDSGRLRRFGRGRARARPSAHLYADRRESWASSNAAIATAASCSSGDRRTARRHDRSDPRRFLYRSLDPDAARRLAAKHLSAHDDGELYLQYSASEAFGFDDGRLKTADYSSSSGFGLRGVTGETTAFAHANEISEAAIERAAATLKLLDPAKGPPAAAAAAHQPGDVRRGRSAEPGAVRRESRAVREDRRRGPGPRSARVAGQRQRWPRAGA